MKSFKEKKEYYKKRQQLYHLMKSATKFIHGVGFPVVTIDDVSYQQVHCEVATHIFIWFDHYPRVANYSPNHKAYFIGNQKLNISNPTKMSNKVIAFVRIVTK